ncbi:MAG: AMP-binding protein [Bacilli bacterium]|nr:AMP-binding protein [Bacilli bacterium]
MINQFLKTCELNDKKDAFRWIRNNKLYRKTFEELLDDVNRFCNLFKKNNLKTSDKIILFVKPSYEMYVTILASMSYGLNIVVIDSFNNSTRLKEMINISKAQYIFINNDTRLIANFIFGSFKKINISQFHKYSSNFKQYLFENNNIVLTTFTSGTTGTPKIISRSFNDLSLQIKLLMKNYTLNKDDVVISLLPIYVLLSIFNGNTTCIIKNITNKNVLKLNGNVILGKISKILKIKQKINSIKTLYLGGAYIYNNEAKKIINTFPDAEIIYTYGASEGVTIGINSLKDFYTNHRFKMVDGLKVNIINKINGVGEICIQGESVLGINHSHNTQDIGYFENEYLYIVGRKKYSSLENLFYNYVNDQLLREKYSLKKVYSLWYNDKIYCFSNRRVKNSNIIKVKKFPYDLKHKTKIDYSRLIQKYIK